jgi:hypothetical protein
MVQLYTLAAGVLDCFIELSNGILRAASLNYASLMRREDRRNPEVSPSVVLGSS